MTPQQLKIMVCELRSIVDRGEWSGARLQKFIKTYTIATSRTTDNDTRLIGEVLTAAGERGGSRKDFLAALLAEIDHDRLRLGRLVASAFDTDIDTFNKVANDEMTPKDAATEILDRQYRQTIFGKIHYFLEYHQTVFGRILYCLPHRTYWNKLPGVRQFLCWIGRHEMLPVMVVVEKGKGIGVEQACLYCGMVGVSGWFLSKEKQITSGGMPLVPCRQEVKE